MFVKIKKKNTKKGINHPQFTVYRCKKKKKKSSKKKIKKPQVPETKFNTVLSSTPLHVALG
jgi:hypothetical protein